MKRSKQFQPLVISTFGVSQWPHPVHRHNHYELIYISHGTGAHHIGEHEVAYNKGDIFMRGPDDEHYFNIATSTKFVYQIHRYLYPSGERRVCIRPSTT